MSTIRPVTETLIRLVKQQIHSDAVLVFPDDVFEVKRTPSVVLQGPRISADQLRRSPTRCFECDTDTLSFEECRFPRLYHLDFDVIVTTSRELELLDFQECFARFLLQHTSIEIPGKGTLGLTELLPLGGLARVNLSNLRQSAGRFRIEDCPIYDEEVREGKLITSRAVEIRGDVTEEITL